MVGVLLEAEEGLYQVFVEESVTVDGEPGCVRRTFELADDVRERDKAE